MMPKTTIKPKFPQSDHDLLIVVSTKLDGLSEDVRTLSSGLYKRVDDIEADVERNKKWINDFNVRWKLVVGMVGALGVIFTTIATLIITSLYNRFFGG